MFRRTQDPLRRERSFDYRAVTSYGGPFQTSSSTSFLCNSVQSVLQPQEASLLVWANPVSLAATQGIAFAFSSSGYLDVSVPRVCLLISYEFRYGYHSITSGGFPHSEISGSKLAYSSTKHIGVRPVLHRLLVPRHPPCDSHKEISEMLNITESTSRSQYTRAKQLLQRRINALY